MSFLLKVSIIKKTNDLYGHLFNSYIPFVSSIILVNEKYLSAFSRAFSLISFTFSSFPCSSSSALANSDSQYSCIKTPDSPFITASFIPPTSIEIIGVPVVSLQLPPSETLHEKIIKVGHPYSL